jgi:hypothetical protein
MVKDRNLFKSYICGYAVFPAAFVEEAVFSPSYALGSFVENQLAIYAWIYVWVLILNHLFSCVLLRQSHAIFIVIAL